MKKDASKKSYERKGLADDAHWHIAKKEASRRRGAARGGTGAHRRPATAAAADPHSLEAVEDALNVLQRAARRRQAAQER
eukprot:gene40496-41520_t